MKTNNEPMTAEEFLKEFNANCVDDSCPDADEIAAAAVRELGGEMTYDEWDTYYRMTWEEVAWDPEGPL